MIRIFMMCIVLLTGCVYQSTPDQAVLAAIETCNENGGLWELNAYWNGWTYAVCKNRKEFKFQLDGRIAH